MDRCILAATDGQPHSLAALRCASDLATRLSLSLEIVSVCEPAAVFGYEAIDLVAGVVDELATVALSERRWAVEAQCTAAGISPTDVHVAIGTPAAVITRRAADRRAWLIVVGREGHGPLDRVLRDETALRLMQSAHTPVMSVPHDYVVLPSRVVAAVDFTTYSLDAARCALGVLTPGSELHVVHVNADQSAVDLSSWRETEWGRAMRSELQSRLDAVVHDLAATASGVTVTGHLVDGRPVAALLRITDQLDADMLATGTNGYGFLGRLLMGSVATQLVRRARCITLVAPPRGIVPGGEHIGVQAHRSRQLPEPPPALSGTAA